MKKYLPFILVLFTTFYSVAQQSKSALAPFIAVHAGGCVDNPFQFTIGMQKTLKGQFSMAYDIQFWKTNYEDICDDVFSKGNYQTITPSIKLFYQTGKEESKGLVIGLGLGYMFARDRGTEQSYIYKEDIKSMVYGEPVEGKWDFNSIAPSVTIGVNCRLFKLPASFNSMYYFACSTEGWVPASGGVGLKLGLRKVK